MRSLYLLFSLTVMSFKICFSQSADMKADSLRQEGKLFKAIEAYKTTYQRLPKNRKNTYNLACAYALTFQKDSAYRYLYTALEIDSSLWALADTDLYALIEDPRWLIIEENQLMKFQKKNGVLKQPAYTKQLLRIILKDQSLDYFTKQARNYYMKNGNAPYWYYPINAFKQRIIKGNYDKIEKLITKYGWPKYSNVGKLAADAPLLVINHHENESVRKKYLPQIEQTCLDGEGSCIEFAKIHDRILVNENKLQTYGMQFRYNAQRILEPFPIKDPEYVDRRRKEIGLEPLKEYLKRKINFDWTVEQK